MWPSQTPKATPSQTTTPRSRQIILEKLPDGSTKLVLPVKPLQPISVSRSNKNRNNATSQQRDNVNNHNQVYKSINQVENSPALVNNNSLSNSGQSNKENYLKDSSIDELITRFQGEKTNLRRQSKLCLKRRLPTFCDKRLERSKNCNNVRLCSNTRQSNCNNGKA